MSADFPRGIYLKRKCNFQPYFAFKHFTCLLRVYFSHIMYCVIIYELVPCSVFAN